MGIYCISFRSRYANRYPPAHLELSEPKFIKNIGQPNSNPNFSKKLVPWAKNNGRWPISTSEVLSVAQILFISTPKFKRILEFFAVSLSLLHVFHLDTQKSVFVSFYRSSVSGALRKRNFASNRSKKTVCVHNKRDRFLICPTSSSSPMTRGWSAPRNLTRWWNSTRASTQSEKGCEHFDFWKVSSSPPPRSCGCSVIEFPLWNRLKRWRKPVFVYSKRGSSSPPPHAERTKTLLWVSFAETPVGNASGSGQRNSLGKTLKETRRVCPETKQVYLSCLKFCRDRGEETRVWASKTKATLHTHSWKVALY